jgi:hypothetical protein
MITVPSFALHYDPDSYPDPETFNPDRYYINKERCYFFFFTIIVTMCTISDTGGAPITKLNVTRTLFFRLEWGLVTVSACDLPWKKSK